VLHVAQSSDKPLELMKKLLERAEKQLNRLKSLLNSQEIEQAKECVEPERKPLNQVKRK
jgi:DNA-binding MurR/RpiR family transcriptional regulator